MTAPVHALRPDQPADAPDAPGVAFSAWDYGHQLARCGAAGLLGTTAYAVLHTIASHANKQAQAEVGMACIARECGLSRRTVITAVRLLIACRALGRYWRRDEDTMTNEVNLYVILPLDGIIANPQQTRRKEHAREHGQWALAPSSDMSAGCRARGSDDAVTTSDAICPSDDTVTTPSDDTVTTPSDSVSTTLVTVSAPKASPLSIPLLSIPNKHPLCALGEPSAPSAQGEEEHVMTDQELATEQALLDPKASAAGKNGSGKSRRKPMTEEEKQAVKSALARFNERLRPIVDEEYGRFVRETLGGIRGFGLDHFLATVDLMATNPRFVDDPHVTPVLVTKTVPIWEDNGKPRSWRDLQECKKRRMQNGRH